MFKVTMTNLGRKHATEIQMFDGSPTYYDLWGMAKEYLFSNHICFNIHTGDFNKQTYPVSGHVLAGAHYVGDFKVEEVAKCNF
jgi:hypothetical protein